jgi:hypothetical protein
MNVYFLKQLGQPSLALAVAASFVLILSGCKGG